MIFQKYHKICYERRHWSLHGFKVTFQWFVVV